MFCLGWRTAVVDRSLQQTVFADNASYDMPHPAEEASIHHPEGRTRSIDVYGINYHSLMTGHLIVYSGWMSRLVSWPRGAFVARWAEPWYIAIYNWQRGCCTYSLKIRQSIASSPRPAGLFSKTRKQGRKFLSSVREQPPETILPERARHELQGSHCLLTLKWTSLLLRPSCASIV